MNDELLLVILFFGFRRFPASFPGARSIAFPSPKAGADPRGRTGLLPPDMEVPASLFGAASAEGRPSLGASCILACIPERALLFVGTLKRDDGSARELMDSRVTLVPPVAGCGLVASGLGLIMGVSEGWGGGVAK